MKICRNSLRCLLAVGLLAAFDVFAQFNPLSIVGSAVSTAMDVRTKTEVKNDTEISVAANKRLLDDKRAEWSGVTLLVFAQHVVIAGAVKSDDAKRIVAEVVRTDQRIRSLIHICVAGAAFPAWRDQDASITAH